MEGNSDVWCSKCGRSVRKNVLAVHKSFCRGIGDKPKFYSNKSNLKKNISKPARFRQTPTSKNKPSRISQTIPQTDVEAIFCPKCSQHIDITDIEAHVDNCNYQLCDFCSSPYPAEFLDEHRRYCRISNDPMTNKYNVSESEDNEDQMEEERQSDSGYYDDGHFEENVESFFNYDNFTSTPLLNQQPNVFNNMFFSNFNNFTTNSNITIQRIHRDHSGNVTRTVTRFTNDDIHPHMMNDVMAHRDLLNMHPELFTEEVIERLLEELNGGNRGLNRNLIDRIPKTTYKASNVNIDEEKDKCPICITELEDNVEIRKMPCDHIFHPRCIDTWLSTNSQCPICKFEVKDYFTNN